MRERGAKRNMKDTGCGNIRNVAAVEIITKGREDFSENGEKENN